MRKRHYTNQRAFRQQLIDHAAQNPEQPWLAWPDQHLLAEGSFSTFTARVNGAKGGWPRGFEARIRGGVLYARYLGE